MHAVVLTIHTLIVIALIGVVLIQRSDGGALGLGGGGGGGGFMTSRGAANVLTRTTSVLAALFFATSLTLAITARSTESDAQIIEDLTGEQVRDPSAPATADDLLRTLGGGEAETPAAPQPAPSLDAAPVESEAPAGDDPASDSPADSAEEDPAPQQ
ncbi:MAG: preprotein translocase subunit SecG [Parvularculaceae bacterium]